MPTTRSDPLEHLLLNVFDAANADHPFCLAVEAAGVVSIEDLLEISKSDWLSLAFSGPTDDEAVLPMTTSLTLSQANRIMSFVSWFGAQEDHTDATVLALTPDTLRDHRRALSLAAPPNVPVSAPVATNAPSVALSHHTLSAADEFKKGIRRDPKAFTTFRERKHWHVWHRTFRATAIAQGLGNLLDSSYAPSTPDEQALFDMLQAYGFAVFTTVLKQPGSSALVRRFDGSHAGSDEGNAQKLYTALVSTMSDGVAAQTARIETETKLRALRLGRNWNKVIVAFLTHLQLLIHDLRELREPGDTSSYNDNWCISTVQSALSTHHEMQSHIQSLSTNRANIVSMLSTQGMAVLPQTFDTYFASLKDHALALDQHATQKRAAHQTHMSSGGQGGRGGSRGGRRGGRGGPGRGGGRGGNSGRSSNESSGPLSGDVTDPAIYLSDSQYRQLTGEQRRRRYERLQAQRSTQANAASTTPAPSVLSVIAPATAPPDVGSIAPSEPGSFLRGMMSNASTRSDTPTEFSMNGVTYRRTNATTVLRVNATNMDVPGALVDGGANGGLLGSGARVLETDLIPTANVVGVTSDVMEDLPLVQAAARIETLSDGPVIAIMSSYAQRSDGGRTIHSKLQLESFGLLVDDTLRTLGGKQCIVTNEGYVLPLSIRDGLPYLDMSPPSDEDLDTLPHVFTCSDSPWDPQILDAEFNPYDFEPPDVAIARRNSVDSRVSDYGRYINHVDTIVRAFAAAATTVLAVSAASLSAFPQRVQQRLPDLDVLRPNFGWIPVDRIRDTLKAIAQYYRATVHHPFRKHFKSRFPAANVHRLPEWVSTDTIFSDTPALDDGIPSHGGCKMLQLFAGLDSYLLAGYPMSSESQIADTFEEFIRDHGAPLGLKSDNARSETGSRMHDLFRMYAIRDKQSEPHYEHQNPVERRIQDVKRMTNNIMDCTGAPDRIWLLCTLFVLSLLNVIVNPNGVVPLSVVTNQMVDMSAFLSFHCWQEVFFEEPDKSERLGRWVGVAAKYGDILTYLVLTHDTERVVAQSNVRPAKDPVFPNRRARLATGTPRIDAGEMPLSLSPVVHTVSDAMGVDSSMLEVPKFSPHELLGLTFFHETEDGNRIRAQVTRKVMDRDAENHQNIKFLVSIGNGELEELIAYNELSDIIERQHQAEADGEIDTWILRDVVAHEGPLNSSSSRYKGSSYNVLVMWEDGSKTWEPLNLVGKDDPVTLANYAKENDFLEVPGWKFLRQTGRHAKKLQRMLNQVRKKSKKNAVRYKFGVRVPRSVQEAHMLDAENGNTL